MLAERFPRQMGFIRPVSRLGGKKLIVCPSGFPKIKVPRASCTPEITPVRTTLCRFRLWETISNWSGTLHHCVLTLAANNVDCSLAMSSGQAVLLHKDLGHVLLRTIHRGTLVLTTAQLFAVFAMLALCALFVAPLLVVACRG